MSQDTEVDVAEVDMKEVELNELEPEKQPMNAAAPPAAASGAEKNGVVKVKVADDEAELAAAASAAKFTGLSKEELLKVAGSPGWVRTRWALLLLFWLGWLGMLAGAVVIIVQAPRCRELPVQRWWHQGALYRIGALKAFQGQPSNANASLAGLKAHLDYLSTLKVKALVLGPIHKNLEDDLARTDLLQIDPSMGSQEEFTQLLETAKKKNIQIILDLTPNYQSQSSWFLKNESEEVNGKMKEALSFWLKAGVSGIQVHDIQKLTDAASFLSQWNNLTHSISDDRVLIAGTGASDLSEILSLLNDTDLLSSSYLEDFERRSSGKELKESVDNYLSATGGRWCSWTYSQAGHLASYVPAHLLRLYHLLLFTLPGTPIFSYGDEIGLQAATLPGQPAEAPIMLWDEKTLGPSESVNLNMTVQGQNNDPTSLLALFRKLSDSRGKERSLLHGDFVVLPTQDDLFAYVRYWDQNERFVTVLNLGPTSQEVELKMPPGASSQKLELPQKAALVLSTHGAHQEGSMLPLHKLPLAPGEGLLLKFPYVA
ncbi:amino acid transporter heavy chain SLC3A2 [Petaurus breviceps papuanus]|uniref:amino acid transporter heavy chain SLC3A2 n=1 Tax=Petaurus breviceps papuanus TaxID=3040969 RepID=UPI0036DC2F10